MRSMTGFGQAAGRNDRHQVFVSLRSVNARYLDLAMRLKDEYRAAEPVVRALLESELSRGRIDATVEIRPSRPLPAAVEIQSEVVRALHGTLHEMAEKGLLAGDLSAGDLLRLPEVLQIRIEPDTLDEDDEALIAAAAGEALAALVAGRTREGAALGRILGERLDELGAVAGALRQRSALVREQIGENLRRRIAELLDGPAVDESRLAQEVALLADRADVTEEVDRLEAHLIHFREVMEAEGAIGKRLDFLSQEILRELNTLGAKGRDAELTRHVLDGKVICEQLREQVQNVE